MGGRSYTLTPHKKGYWVKTINGKQHRIGKRYATRRDALGEWRRVKDQLLAGRAVAAPERSR